MTWRKTATHPDAHGGGIDEVACHLNDTIGDVAAATQRIAA